jgi:hypothetical protein
MTSHGSGRVGIVVAVSIALLALGMGTAVSYAPPAEGQMAVVFRPGVGEAAAFGAIVSAGGKIIGPSRFGNIVVVFAPDRGFSQRIRAAGALFTIAAQGLCSPDRQPSKVI